MHDNDKPHAFSSEEKGAVREWMKAIMKATIGRDYTSASFFTLGSLSFSDLVLQRL